MREQPKEARQSWGCGYIPANPRIPVLPWQPPSYDVYPDERDERGRLKLPVCPGYVCNLPEVIEATHARSWHAVGELTQWCDGGQATPQIREAIAVLNHEQARVDRWRAQEKK